MHDPNRHAIILFDGVCNVCNHSVQFIIHRDKNGYFLFASLQSSIAESLLSSSSIDISITEMSSIVLIEGDRYFTESTAILRICKRLNGIWKGFYALIIVPKIFRDPLYRRFSKNRYRLKTGQNSSICCR